MLKFMLRQGLEPGRLSTTPPEPGTTCVCTIVTSQRGYLLKSEHPQLISLGDFEIISSWCTKPTNKTGVIVLIDSRVLCIQGLS